MTAWLDRLLGRVTMYVLVIIALTALAVIAAVLSLFGWFSFGPLEILASAAVLLVVTLASNWIAGRIVRMQPQTASSIITALLLFFIFPPSLSPAYLGILAVAGVIASASKYLLAVRGRHIFNPAAVGAMAVSLIPAFQQQGVYALWWLGTPIMLPFVAVAAFAILFRTRKLWLGGLFVVVATAAITIYSAVNGLPVSDALSGALLSSPQPIRGSQCRLAGTTSPGSRGARRWSSHPAFRRLQRWCARRLPRASRSSRKRRSVSTPWRGSPTSR